MTQFSDLGLAAPILGALAAKGYTAPTPIQAGGIPPILDGRDLLGIAATGTGKTAAFALPILHRLAADRRPTPRGSCRALVLAPTRELAAQIAASFRAYGERLGTRIAVVVGGVSMRPQIVALAKGVDVVVATPGRLLDHLESGNVRFDSVETLVLDEADHMLDLGFIPSIRKLVRRLPRERQTLFFSATMPNEIGKLANEFLVNPARVSVTPPATTSERVDQRVVFTPGAEKTDRLVDILRADRGKQVLIFTRTKRGADKLVRSLERVNIEAAAIHGNKSQGQRERALAGFRSGRTPILVATDIAARGIDVTGIALVVNYDLPNVPETYVHRIGRTARAGAGGRAITFCGPDERKELRRIETLIRQSIPSAGGPGRAEQTPPAESPVDKTARPSVRPSAPAKASEDNPRRPRRNRRRRAPARIAAEAATNDNNAGGIAEVAFVRDGRSGGNAPLRRRKRA